MYKNNLKKVVAVVLSVVSLCSTGMLSYANVKNNSDFDYGIAPNYIAISSTYTALYKNSNGSLNCDADTVVWRDNAGVKAELQRYDGGWKTIKTWSDKGEDFASVDNDWFVASGYDYRLKTTHYAYDSNWNTVETVVKYSKTVSK